MLSETPKNRLKRLRKEFREGVFKRDGHHCVMCGSTIDLDAHHIVDRHKMPNDGYAISNGITLCGGERLGSCHMKAEFFHIKEGKEWIKEFHPDDLYKKIGSSKEKAIEDCEKLK